MTDSIQRVDNYSPAPEPLHLRDYLNVLRRRRGLALLVLLLIVSAGVARALLVRPVYEATAQILIDQETPRVLDFDQNARAGMLWEDFYQTQYRLLQSRLLAGKTVEQLNLTRDPEFVPSDPAAPPPDMERTIDAFIARLQVQPVKNSQLVSVTFEAGRPDLAAKAANTLTQVYMQHAFDLRHKTSAEAEKWLVEENKDQAKKIETAEGALTQFKEREGLVSIEERRMLTDQKLKDLGSSLTAAKTRRLEKESLFNQMRSTSNPENLGDVLRSPLVQSLQGELASLERQNAQLAAAGYLGNHPEMVKVRDQLDGTRKKLALEASRIVNAAETDYRAAVANESAVSSALEGAKAEALTLAQKGQHYDALKRDLDGSKQLSDSILVRQKQTDAVRDAPASNVHVIDPAVPPQSPIRPRPVRDIALTVLLGLACAVGATFLFDYLDTSVRNPGDLRALGLPLLGVIPEARTKRRRPPVVTQRGGKQAFIEGYRVLRTALHPPIELEKQGQVLVVTSTLPGEGKTVTSVNLALTLAAAHESVLLVDADLRRPALSSWLKAADGPGLRDVLAGNDGASAAIRDIPGTDVKLLSSGHSDADSPSDLLATQRFQDLIEELRKRFDHVILDTPPAGAIADALVVAPLADSVLVVARSGKVDRTALVHTLERLSNAGGRVRGVILNRARTDRYHYDYGPGLSPGIFSQRNKRLPSSSSSLDLITRA